MSTNKLENIFGYVAYTQLDDDKGRQGLPGNRLSCESVKFGFLTSRSLTYFVPNHRSRYLTLGHGVCSRVNSVYVVQRVQ